jgi:hypothetical protein
MSQTTASKSQEFNDLRNKGIVIPYSLEQNGATIPDGYKVCRINLDHVISMIWDPIGVWESTPTQVLRLSTQQCRLRVLTADGKEIRFAFKENDYRYVINNWFVTICKGEIQSPGS